MTKLKLRPQGLRFTIQRRPGVIAATGFLTVLLTPFVFFPEIMGDVGVVDASALRNGAAMTFLIVGAILLLVGSALLGRQLLRRTGSKLHSLT